MSAAAPSTKEECLKMFSGPPAMESRRAKHLKFHFKQDGHCNSAPARAMGFAGFQAASLRYGIFASGLAGSMGWAGRTDPEEDCAILALAAFLPQDAEHRRRQRRLQPEAVQALKELGWRPPRPARRRSA